MEQEVEIKKKVTEVIKGSELIKFINIIAYLRNT